MTVVLKSASLCFPSLDTALLYSALGIKEGEPMSQADLIHD